MKIGIRSRTQGLERGENQGHVPVSYTHLDVYKRQDHGREAKGNEAALRERYRELIAENMAYDALLTDYPYAQDTLAEILELLVDVVCTCLLYTSRCV